MGTNPFVSEVPFFIQGKGKVCLFFFFPPIICENGEKFQKIFSFDLTHGRTCVYMLFSMIIFSSPFRGVHFRRVRIIRPSKVNGNGVGYLFPFGEGMEFPYSRKANSVFPFILRLPRAG